MARTRTAKHSKPVEPEDESQEVPDEAAVPLGPQDKGSMRLGESTSAFAEKPVTTDPLRCTYYE